MQSLMLELKSYTYIYYITSAYVSYFIFVAIIKVKAGSDNTVKCKTINLCETFIFEIFFGRKFVPRK